MLAMIFWCVCVCVAMDQERKRELLEALAVRASLALY